MIATLIFLLSARAESNEEQEKKGEAKNLLEKQLRALIRPLESVQGVSPLFAFQLSFSRAVRKSNLMPLCLNLDSLIRRFLLPFSSANEAV